MDKILILDIDGTTADVEHRVHFIDKKNPTKEDWDKFFSEEEIEKDKPIESVKRALDGANSDYYKVIFLTGRPEKSRKATEDWFKKHYNYDIADLRMRSDSSEQASSTFKKQEIEKIKKEFKDKEFIFVDDEKENMSMMREFGDVFSPEEFFEERIIKKAREIVYPPKIVYHVSPYAREIVEQGFILDPSKSVLGAFGAASGISTTTLENALVYKNAIQFITGIATGEYDWKDLEEYGGKKAFNDALDYTMREIFNEFWSFIYEREKPLARRERGENPLGFNWEEFLKGILPNNINPNSTFKEIIDSYQGKDWLRNIAINNVDFYGNSVSEEEKKNRMWIFLKAFAWYTDLPVVIGEFPQHLIGKSVDDVGIVEVEIPDKIEPTIDGVNAPFKEDPRGKFSWHPGETEWRFYDPSDLIPLRVVSQKLAKIKNNVTIARQDILNANQYGLEHRDDLVAWYTPVLQVASDLGQRGIDLSSQPDVSGVRYGSIPSSGLSTNYKDNKCEMGLSLARLGGEEDIGSAIWFSDRKEVKISGLLLPYRGSDVEALILPYGVDNLDFYNLGTEDKIAKTIRLAFPFLAEPPIPMHERYRGIIEYPGFHTTTSVDIAATYAIGRVHQSAEKEDENGVHYLTDYPVVVSLDMSSFEQKVDYDAVNVVKDSLIEQIKCMVKYEEITEDSTDDDIYDAIEHIKGYERESEADLDSALDLLSEETFSHFDFGISALQNDAGYETIRNYIRTGKIPDEILMNVADQYRYTEDVPEVRVKAVYYVTPIANEVLDRDDDEEEFQKKYPGYDVFNKDWAYSGELSPNMTLVWGSENEQLRLLKEVPPERTEYHGTTYKRLLQAAPRIGEELPVPPVPYREDIDVEASNKTDPKQIDSELIEVVYSAIDDLDLKGDVVKEIKTISDKDNIEVKVFLDARAVNEVYEDIDEKTLNDITERILKNRTIKGTNLKINASLHFDNKTSTNCQSKLRIKSGITYYTNEYPPAGGRGRKIHTSLRASGYTIVYLWYSRFGGHLFGKRGTWMCRVLDENGQEVDHRCGFDPIQGLAYIQSTEDPKTRTWLTRPV